MSDSVSIYLPPNVDVVVKGFSNSKFLQRITVMPEGMEDIEFQGSGEHNVFLGRSNFTTPPEETELELNIDYSADGGKTWHPSEVTPGGCQAEALNLAIVVSEDGVGDGFRGAVCLISWPQRPKAG